MVAHNWAFSPRHDILLALMLALEEGRVVLSELLLSGRASSALLNRNTSLLREGGLGFSPFTRVKV